jgi:DNA-binding NarL/FixJ family response regulator
VFNDSDKIFNALCAGASGYILKSDPPHKYLEAINEVYNGGAPVSPSVAKKLLGFFSNKNVVLVTPANTDYQLSDREKELLHLMVEGHNYKDIAEKAFISYETVRTHVKHIYKKLHVASRSRSSDESITAGAFVSYHFLHLYFLCTRLLNKHVTFLRRTLVRLLHYCSFLSFY